MLLPGLPRAGLVRVDLGAAPAAGGQARAMGGTPPTRPRQGKAPQDCFIFVQQDDLATRGLRLEGGKIAARLGEFCGVRIKATRGPGVTQAPLFNTTRMVSGCNATPVCRATAVPSSRPFHCDERAP
jgi:hypothetical protein